MTIHDYLTPKQLQVLKTYQKGDFRNLILTGAVRSGKTFIDNLLFLYEIRRTARMAKLEGDKHPQYILAGATSDSINKNVIISCMNQFGIDFKVDRHGHYSLFGVDITPVSTATMTGLKGARGFTAYGAYINEATLGVEPIFQEIQQRCSKAGSHIIVDTNPDNPQHWLKRDYIDNDDPKAKTIKFHFTIDDNTFLAPDYVEEIKASTPSGMFYDRAILGLWVSGEGAVYPDFDERKMVVDEVPEIIRYVAGVDWGYKHYGSIVVWGESRDHRWYLLDERSKRLREIDYWTQVAHEFQDKYGGKSMPFYCDTARTEHVEHFMHHDINAKYGWKKVVPGIEDVSKLMKEGRFFVKKGATERFLEEIYNYRWDDKRSDRDAVVKENDDCMDACRYALASYLHTEEQKDYFPQPSRETITAGMRRFGL